MTATSVKQQRTLKPRTTKKKHILCVIFPALKFCIDFIKFSLDRQLQQTQKVQSDTQAFYRNVPTTLLSSAPRLSPCVVSHLTGFDVSCLFGTGQWQLSEIGHSKTATGDWTVKLSRQENKCFLKQTEQALIFQNELSIDIGKKFFIT